MRGWVGLSSAPHAPTSEVFNEVVTTESRHFPSTRPNTAGASAHPQEREARPIGFVGGPRRFLRTNDMPHRRASIQKVECFTIAFFEYYYKNSACVGRRLVERRG